MFHKEFIREIIVSILFWTLQGCCGLPLVDCGPSINPIRIHPRVFHSGEEMIFTEFKGWIYDNKKKVYIIRIELKIRLEKQILLHIHNEDIYYLKNNKKEIAKQVLILKEEYKDSKKTQLYDIEFQSTDFVFPLTVFMENILLVNGPDTTRARFELALNN